MALSECWAQKAVETVSNLDIFSSMIKTFQLKCTARPAGLHCRLHENATN